MATVPVCQMPKYLDYLRSRITNLGGSFYTETVSDFQTLQQKTKAKVIVNCTGLAAKELAHDAKVYPVRGQIIGLEPTYVHQRLKTLIYDEDNPDGVVYIIPRKDVCMIGTFCVYKC
jgi:D-amino-acid oxidase